MTHGVAEVHLIRKRGVLYVETYGRTPKGVKYIKSSEPMTAKSIKDPLFKSELAAKAIASLAVGPSPQ